MDLRGQPPGTGDKWLYSVLNVRKKPKDIKCPFAGWLPKENTAAVQALMQPHVSHRTDFRINTSTWLYFGEDFIPWQHKGIRVLLWQGYGEEVWNRVITLFEALSALSNRPCEVVRIQKDFPTEADGTFIIQKTYVAALIILLRETI